VTGSAFHGPPGGPPNPPYGDPAAGLRQPPPAQPVSPSEVEPAATEPPPERGVRTRPKVLVASVLAVFAAIAASAWLLTPPGPQVSTGPTPETTPETTLAPAPDTTLAPPTTEPPAPVDAGFGRFAAVSAQQCAGLTGPIGANNLFRSGTAYDRGFDPRITTTGALGEPLWKVELDPQFPAGTLVGDFPVAYSLSIRGVSGDHVLLFAPLDRTLGSNLASYELATGRLAWTAAVQPQVGVLVGETELYLIRSVGSSTVIATVSPATGETVGCFAATAGEGRQVFVSAEGRTAMASDVLHVVLDGDPQLYQSLGGTEVLTERLLPVSGSRLLTEAAGEGEKSRTVVFSTPGEPKVFGLDASTAEDRFTLDTAALEAAELPQDFAEAAELFGRDTLHRNLSALAGGVGASDAFLLAFSDQAGEDLYVVGTDGSVRFALPGPPSAAGNWTGASSAFHVALNPGPVSPRNPRGDGVMLAIDATTGAFGLGLSPVFSPMLGDGPVVYRLVQSPDALDRPSVVVVDGLEELGNAGIPAGSTLRVLSPVAVSPQVLVLYAETSTRRYVFALPLSPPPAPSASAGG
jgi:hypothetical protein